MSIFQQWEEVKNICMPIRASKIIAEQPDSRILKKKKKKSSYIWIQILSLGRDLGRQGLVQFLLYCLKSAERSFLIGS